MEGFGTSQFHIEYGPSSSQVSNPGGVLGTTAGTHTYGVLWSTTGVTFAYDGVVVGSETASLSGPMYLVMENSMGSPSVLNATMTACVTCVTCGCGSRAQRTRHHSPPAPHVRGTD